VTALAGVSLFGSEPDAALVDITIENGLIAAIEPASAAASLRHLAMPALANAHDHARPLSPTSFGGAGKPLESWLLRLAAMPAVDPYLAALAAFGRAARAGAASVMAHYTRAHGPMSIVDEAREVARAAADVGVRVTFALFMRDRNPLVYGPAEPVLASMPSEARRIVEAQFLGPMPGASEQIARVEAIAAAVESPTFTVQFGPSGPQWCSDELLRAIAENSARTGRRVHMHLLETIYQRRFADAAYPLGVVQHLRDIGLLSERLTLAHCVHARPDELDLIARSGAIIATNPSSNLHLRSGIAPIGEAIERGCRVALGVDASALDEDDDVLREMRLGHFLHGGWGFETRIERAPWLAAIVANGRFANGAPGTGALKVGEAADILVLDLGRLDRDAIMPVAPVDLVFARATSAHVAQLIVAGRQVVHDGRLTGVDLDAVHAALRENYRRNISSRAPFLAAWNSLEAGAAQFYCGRLGCC
jgi:cytosine/adenosine deaminase-related metal-dependent hydrolase